MKAIIFDGKKLKMGKVQKPRAKRRHAVISVHLAGICSTDLEITRGYMEFKGVPGHEFVGEAVALGEGAGERHGISVGDRVVAEQIVPCEQCRYCVRGLYWLCAAANIFGFKKAVHGGMAEYMKFPAAARVYKVPGQVSPKHAALVEPLACAIHAVERGEIKLGDVVVQVGCGTLGLCMVAVERLKKMIE